METDSVLLASWIDENKTTILDIGTGSGIIALILAHKFPDSSIEAIDIDINSTKQALENIKECYKKQQINIHNISFQDYINQYTLSNTQIPIQNSKFKIQNFDLIVTNPPYFSNSLKSASTEKNLWPHNDSLSQETLLYGVSKLLAADGYFYIILPHSESHLFIDNALKESLHVTSKLNIKPKEDKPINRIMLKMSKNKADSVSESEISIRQS